MSNDLYLSNDPLGLWQGDGLDELGDLCRSPCPESRRTIMVTVGATEAECSEEDAATLRRFLADEKKC